MTKEELEALEAKISELDRSAAKARELKRKRRAIVAGKASGQSRKAKVGLRDKAIRQAYADAEGQRGAVSKLAVEFKLSRRQVARILGSSVGSHGAA